MEIIKLKFNSHGDERGSLIAIEEGLDIPFSIKRVYYVFDTLKNVHRGFHSHKKLEQILICVSGSCKILLDDGKEKSIVNLDKNDEGLYIGPDMWREMFEFSENAILLVLASEVYEENDYIRDYDEFISYRINNN